MKNIKKKLLSLGLSAAMIGSYAPMSVFADEAATGNTIEVSTYQELKDALGYFDYDTEQGKFVAVTGTAQEGDTVKLTADLVAETDSDNPKGNKRTGVSATDARFDATTGATITVTANNVSIDGDGHTIDGDGYPTFDFDASKGVELKNMTIEDGAYTAKLGGAIFVEYGAEVTIDNVTMKDCVAKSAAAYNGGGAIYINNHRGDAPVVTVKNSTFINNKAGVDSTGLGGAIYGSTAKLTVENSTFIANKAANGAAIAMDGPSSLVSKDNTFKKNKAVVAGGAVYVYDGLSNAKKGMTTTSEVPSVITGSTYINNTAGLVGNDVVYGRYYDETFEGDTTKTTLESDAAFEDVTFANKERTELAEKAFEAELTINNIKYNAGTISGKGQAGATVTAYVGDVEIGTAVVAEDGTYKMDIQAQEGGTEVTVKMTKEGYTAVEATKAVLKQIKEYELNRILPTSTSITGTAMKGAYVRAYVDGVQIGETVKVDNNGKFSIAIDKLAVGTDVTVKVSKKGFYTRSKTTTVLNIFSKDLKVNSVKAKATKVTGKAQAGAYVRAYVDGVQIGKGARVDSKGKYTITIPKQAKGTKITVRMSKTGYLSVYETVTVK